MKNQALFSLKDKSKKLKCRLLQFLFGALTIKSDQGLCCLHKPSCNHAVANEMDIGSEDMRFTVCVLIVYNKKRSLT